MSTDTMADTAFTTVSIFRQDRERLRQLNESLYGGQVPARTVIRRLLDERDMVGLETVSLPELAAKIEEKSE